MQLQIVACAARLDLDSVTPFPNLVLLLPDISDEIWDGVADGAATTRLSMICIKRII